MPAGPAFFAPVAESADAGRALSGHAITSAIGTLTKAPVPVALTGHAITSALGTLVSVYEPEWVSVTDDGVVRNGPGYYAGFMVASSVAGTVNVYNGPNATLGDLIHTVVNPVSGTWYYATGVDNVTDGLPTTDSRATWIECISVYVVQPNQETSFLLDDDG